MRPRRLVCAVVAAALAGFAGAGSAVAARMGPSAGPGGPTSPLHDRPLPPSVPVPDPPQGVALADPAFAALPGATADFGTLGGATYQVEVPDHWNGRLVLWMHGFADLVPQARVGPPDFRHYLISHGFAWAASSFSSTSLIPSGAADETAALWDYFVRAHGRPTWTYVTGGSMGGWAAEIAAERYGNRFDGALGMCGATGTTPALRISAEQLVAGAFVAGVSQAEFDAAPDVGQLIQQRIRLALQDPRKHRRFENILIALTGGPRAFAREGIHFEEDTNWARASLVVTLRIVPPRDQPYRLARGSGVTSAQFNRHAIRFPVDKTALRTFSQGMEVTGDLQMPLLTLHTTGDGEVPINQAQILGARVRVAGRSSRLVQRVIEDPGHCGFTTAEQEAALAALVTWVEHGHKPTGTNLAVQDLRRLDRTFALEPRPGAAGTSAGSVQHATVSGHARLDGKLFDARFIGAVVRDDGLVTPCQTSLPTINRGRYRIGVLGQHEASGCGGAGTEIILWTYVGSQKLWATTPIPWPGSHTARADVTFSSTDPRGAAPTVTELSGDVYRPDGRRAELGSRVEAFIDGERCGVATFRNSGSFTGYIMNIVGPDAVPACRSGALVTFRVNGAPAVETISNSPAASAPLDLTVR